MRLALLFLVLIVLEACKKDDVPPNPYALDPVRFPVQISEHLNTFMKEADKRGVKIELDKYVRSFKIGGKTDFINTNGLPPAGYYDHEIKIIYIDTTSYCYKYYPEILVSHELGHSVLQREHKPGFFPNSTDPISIMNGSYTPEWDQSTIYKRQYYFDELFNQNTPYPYWSINHN